MKKALPDVQAEIMFNNLPIFRRFFHFLWRIRFRIFLVVTLGGLFNYWGNLLGLGTSKIERQYRKYKKRWIFRNNPSLITYDTALETLYEPKNLTRPSTNILSEQFVRIDRELEHGVSRQLVIDSLESQGLLEDAREEVSDILEASEYRHIRSKKLNSMSLKEYLQLVESKVYRACKDEPVKEIELVQKFTTFMEEHKDKFYEKCIKDIEWMELSIYEQNQLKKK